MITTVTRRPIGWHEQLGLDEALSDLRDNRCFRLWLGLKHKAVQAALESLFTSRRSRRGCDTFARAVNRSR
jgi:hypothetical protein